jgi:hypothetical protein
MGSRVSGRHPEPRTLLEKYVLRAIIALGFLVVSTLMIWGAFLVGADSNEGSLFINLGTEIFGILITVALVEWLFERRRLQDRGRELAWNVFHALERAVWVWQGGPSQMGTDALLGLIHGIGKTDPLPQFTRTLLVNLGSQSREALDKEAPAIRLLPGMEPALADLTSLRSLSDGDFGVWIRMVREAALIRYRDSTERAQEERYYAGKGWTPKAEGRGKSKGGGSHASRPSSDRPRTA